MLNLLPTSDLVLIRRHTVADLTTPAGILLPPVEDSADTPYRGTVVFAGKGKKATVCNIDQTIIDLATILLNSAQSLAPNDRLAPIWQKLQAALEAHHAIPQRIPMEVQPGDEVIFSKNLLQEFKIDGEVLVACGEASILGVVG